MKNVQKWLDRTDTPLESDIERPAREYAQRRGWTVRKLRWLDVNGAPDDFFARDGVIILAEFKRPGKPVDIHQQIEIGHLRAAGVRVEAGIDNMERVREIFY